MVSGQGFGKKDAKKFLKKDHHDQNMVVAIRIRPLSNNERESISLQFDSLFIISPLNLVSDKLQLTFQI